ncbi:MAG: hypothetical protein ACI8Q1_001853 [Parvicella sp.]|jgi:hypothetical protein
MSEEEKKRIQERIKRENEAKQKALREKLEREKREKFKKGADKSDFPRGGGSDDR